MKNQGQLQDPEFGQPDKGASFLKTYFNGLNTLLGIGILSMPYALSQGGWLSLTLLIFAAVTCCYTGLLLQRCLDTYPKIKSYPDIGYVAFGNKGRVVIASFLYLELYLVATDFLILGGDSLEYLFPNINLKLGPFRIRGKTGFILLTTMPILPTTWLRNLGGVLAYISASGVLASVILMCCVLWAAVIDGVGFHEEGHRIKVRGFPLAVSLFNFCYCAHAVFPTIRDSMKDTSKFSKVLLASFVTSTITYGFLAIIGYKMFGDDSKSQVILNLPMKKKNTYVAIYTILFVTFTKYAMTVTPIAMAIEDKFDSQNNRVVSITIRTTIVISTMLVAIFIPFFGYIMAFIGAFSGIALAWLFPCLCYIKINGTARKSRVQFMVIIGIIVAGSIICIFGTYISVREIVNKLQNS